MTPKALRELSFYKYQGTGNDFIMIDGVKESVNFSASEISKLCDRRFGIGADGLIILKSHPEYHFEMDYYNADGSQSFCGNGSRCAQAFAQHLGLIENESVFLAIDGVHQGRISDQWFETKMGEVDTIDTIGEDFFVNTGSPHHIVYVNNVDTIDVQKEGSAIRYSVRYQVEGTNVNFVEVQEQYLKVRTYERGVEAETYSCGTGVTAVALAHTFSNAAQGDQICRIKTKGGELAIKFQVDDKGRHSNIWLCGPAIKVYEGVFKWP